jgi:type IV secretion system protein VirD4
MGVDALAECLDDMSATFNARPVRRSPMRGLAVRGSRPGRVTLGRVGGRLVAAEPLRSAIALAPTQSRKTSGLAVPAILEWPGPVVATSVKTDLVRHTLGFRRQLGETAIFDPVAVTGLARAQWTPLTGFR